MYLLGTPKHMGSVTWQCQEERSGKEHNICAMDVGVQVNLMTDHCEKTELRIATPPTELNNLLTLHCMTNAEECLYTCE